MALPTLERYRTAFLLISGPRLYPVPGRVLSPDVALIYRQVQAEKTCEQSAAQHDCRRFPSMKPSAGCRRRDGGAGRTRWHLQVTQHAATCPCAGPSPEALNIGRCGVARPHMRDEEDAWRAPRARVGPAAEHARARGALASRRGAPARAKRRPRVGGRAAARLRRPRRPAGGTGPGAAAVRRPPRCSSAAERLRAERLLARCGTSKHTESGSTARVACRRVPHPDGAPHSTSAAFQACSSMSCSGTAQASRCLGATSSVQHTPSLYVAFLDGGQKSSSSTAPTGSARDARCLALSGSQ